MERQWRRLLLRVHLRLRERRRRRLVWVVEQLLARVPALVVRLQLRVQAARRQRLVRVVQRLVRVVRVLEPVAQLLVQAAALSKRLIESKRARCLRGSELFAFKSVSSS
jgi:hypothetical protein